MAEDENEQMSFTMIGWRGCALYPLLFALRKMIEMSMVVTIAKA